MVKIAALIEEKGWTQVEAASRCGVTQPRINDLLCGRISRIALDALVNIAAALKLELEGRASCLCCAHERACDHLVK